MRSLRTAKVRTYEAKYREKMYGWVSRLKNKHRVKLKGLDGDFSTEQWKDRLKEFDNKCAKCGEEGNLTFDHVVPLSLFREWALIHKPNYRANDIENLQPLCRKCNSSKGNR